MFAFVFRDFFVANRHKIIKVKCRKLVIIQALQRFILNHFDKVVTEIFFNPFAHQIDIDLHEQLLVLRCSVCNRDFGKVIEHRVIVAVFPTKEISQIFLGAFNLVNLLNDFYAFNRFILRADSHDIRTVLLGKLYDGI